MVEEFREKFIQSQHIAIDQTIESRPKNKEVTAMPGQLATLFTTKNKKVKTQNRRKCK